MPDSNIKSLTVTLIQPPASGGVMSLLPQVESEGEGIGFKPPIGLLYIATYLNQRTPHKATIIDSQAERLSIEATIARVVKQAPDIIGISAWTEWWYPTHELGRLLKQALPNAHICYGGPHIGIFHEETLARPHTGSVIVGDGEIPMAALCDRLAGGDQTPVPGLHLKQDGVDMQNLFHIQKDLDILPIPDRTILPLNNYTSVIGKSDFISTMITSRGCPYQCIYCKLNFQKTICRSASSVLEEFEQLRKLGVREVEIYDDTFTWSKQRVVDICEGLIKQNNKIQWAIRDRVNKSDPGLLDLMKKAGCSRIHYGIESGDDEVLKLIKKNITTAQARDAVRAAMKKGFTVLTYFMFGNKGETLDKMKKTVAFAMELNSHYAQFSITIPYPGTEMYKEALEEGTIPHDFWREYATNPSENFKIPMVYEKYASLEQLRRIRDEAIKKYYFRPSYIIRELMHTRNISVFARKARMASHLLKNLLIGRSGEKL